MSAGNVKDFEYYIDKKLIAKWDAIKDGKLKKLDTDRVYIVDGRERTGKSTFAFQQAFYIDSSLYDDLSRICFTADEFLEKIRNTESTDTETKVVVFDEAFRGLSSKASMSKVNKKIVEALMEVGQKNLVLFIISPSFFMLELYPAMIRSNALFHIRKEKQGNRRAYEMYNYAKKGKLYQIGIRKGWEYRVRTRFNGRFYESGIKNTEFWKKYTKKKENAFRDNTDPEIVGMTEINKRQWLLAKFLTWYIIDVCKVKQRELSRESKKRGMSMTHVTIGDYVKQMRLHFGIQTAKYGVLPTATLENKEKTTESDGEDIETDDTETESDEISPNNP